MSFCAPNSLERGQGALDRAGRKFGCSGRGPPSPPALSAGRPGCGGWLPASLPAWQTDAERHSVESACGSRGAVSYYAARCCPRGLPTAQGGRHRHGDGWGASWRRRLANVWTEAEGCEIFCADVAQLEAPRPLRSEALAHLRNVVRLRFGNFLRQQREPRFRGIQLRCQAVVRSCDCTRHEIVW